MVSQRNVKDFDDELIWLGGEPCYSARPNSTSKPNYLPSEEIIPCDKEEWDCPTDILYCHAGSEDFESVKPSKVKAPVPKVEKTKDKAVTHPMFSYQPYDSSRLRAVKAAWDPSTWDSPTDILYAHHCDDDVVLPAEAFRLGNPVPESSQSTAINTPVEGTKPLPAI